MPPEGDKSGSLEDEAILLGVIPYILSELRSMTLYSDDYFLLIRVMRCPVASVV